MVFLLNIVNLSYNLEEKNKDNFNLNETMNLKINKICKAKFEIGLISHVLTLLMRTYIPIGLMIFFSVCILKNLLKVSKSKKIHKMSKREAQFTRTVIFSNVYFLIFYLPLLVYYILSYVFKFSSNSESQELKESHQEWINFLYLMTILIAYFYQMFSFFINFSINFLFRKEVKIFFGKKTKKEEKTSETIFNRSIY